MFSSSILFYYGLGFLGNHVFRLSHIHVLKHARSLVLSQHAAKTAPAPVTSNPITIAAQPATATAWDQDEEHRQREIRIAAGMKRIELRETERANMAALAAVPGHQPLCHGRV
jgi:hypothetical protein